MNTPLAISISLLFISCDHRLTIPNDFRTVYQTDSTSFIEWTDGKVYYRSSKPIENYYIDNKTYTKWKSEKYICLRHSNGSDAWTDIILPFKNNNYRLFENALEYDNRNDIVVFEIDSANFKLIAENIESRQREFIGKDWLNCESVFPHYCIDSLNIKNKVLYIEWVTPNFIDKSNKKEIKTINLKI